MVISGVLKACLPSENMRNESDLHAKRVRSSCESLQKVPKTRPPAATLQHQELLSKYYDEGCKSDILLTPELPRSNERSSDYDYDDASKKGAEALQITQSCGLVHLAWPV